MNSSFSIRLLTIATLLCVLPTVLAPAAPLRKAETLTVVDSDGSEVTLSLTDLRNLPQFREDQCICVGKSSGYIGIFDYSGARLADVLKHAKTTAGAKEYLQENTYVVFKGTDGYQVIASWTEIMESSDGRRALIVLDKDGEPLPEEEGAFRLVLPADKYVGRSVKCLERIEIHRAEGFVDFPKSTEAPATNTESKELATTTTEKVPGR